MPKHVLVDGFNVIRRDPDLAHIEKMDFYRAQQSLIDHLADYRRGTQHQVTVVYDGGGGNSSFRQTSQQKGITIIYSSRGETADEVIEQLVAANQPRRSAYIVVTADRALGEACRRYRVNVLPPEELMRRSKPITMPWHDPDFAHGKQEEQGWSGHTKKKGNSRRKPKKRRQSRGLW